MRKMFFTVISLAIVVIVALVTIVLVNRSQRDPLLEENVKALAYRSDDPCPAGYVWNGVCCIIPGEKGDCDITLFYCCARKLGIVYCPKKDSFRKWIHYVTAFHDEYEGEYEFGDECDD